MLKHTDSNTADIAADLAALREDIARLAKSVQALARHQTRGAGIHVSEVLGIAGDETIETKAKNMRMASRAEFEFSMERNVVTGLAVAFSIGLALGVLIRLRR